ncbi:Os07g0564150, partial [Oryza sativa Japonica Group]
LTHEPLQRRVRRPALLHGLPARRAHLRGLLPRLRRPAALRRHQPPHRALHLRRLHERSRRVAVLRRRPPQLDRDAHGGHGLERVEVLLAVERPCRHRHAEPQALQHRVPAAVRHEPAHGGVSQDVLLRRPPRPHHPSPGGRLQEPLREQLARVRVRRVPHAAGGRAAQDPQEAVAAALQARGELPHLRRVEEADAPEAEEHHRRRRLRVEPPHALVRLLGRQRGVEPDHRPDRVDRRSGAAAVRDRGEDRALELNGGVHDDALRLREAAAVVLEPVVVLHRLAHEAHRHVRRRHRRQPGHVHGSLHAVEPDGQVVPELRQPQHEREERGGGGEVHVRRERELVRRVEQGREEEVHDDRGHGGRQAGDGRLDVVRVALDVPGHELLGRLAAGGVLDGGEPPEGDVEPGSRLPAHVGLDHRRLYLRRRLHDEHGEGDGAPAGDEQPLAGFQRGHEVAGSPGREEDDGWASH